MNWVCIWLCECRDCIAAAYHVAWLFSSDLRGVHSSVCLAPTHTTVDARTAGDIRHAYPDYLQCLGKVSNDRRDGVRQEKALQKFCRLQMGAGDLKATLCRQVEVSRPSCNLLACAMLGSRTVQLTCRCASRNPICSKDVLMFTDAQIDLQRWQRPWTTCRQSCAM